MIYNSSVIKNYADFKKKFLRDDGKTRKNGVLLKYLLARMRNKTNVTPESKVLEISSMNDLETQLFDIFAYSENADSTDFYSCLFDDFFSFYSSGDNVRLDKFCGIVPDDDLKHNVIRYVKNEKVYSMRPGKFLDIVGQSYEFYKILPLQVKRRLQEIFAQRWEAKVSEIKNLELCVDKNFSDIYNSRKLFGDFKSCEVDKNDFDFFNHVDASAAYLKNEYGKIVARCIIWEKVYSYDYNTTFRVADRQYSSEQNDSLKRVLVNRLIENDRIDIYRRIGSGSQDTKDFLWKNGTKFDSDMFVRCKIIPPYKFSYMDSFKYFDADSKILGNTNSKKYDFLFENF